MSSDRANDDGFLVKRMIAGRDEAFDEIYGRCSGPVYRFALHMTGDLSVAEEVTQETFLHLLSNATGFDPARGSLLSWLLGIARNLSRRSLGSVANAEPIDKAIDYELCGESDLLGEYARRELVDLLWQAIASLPPAYREVVLLCEMQELDYGEAAQALVCPVGTVRSRLHRARAMLLTKMQSRCLA